MSTIVVWVLVISANGYGTHYAVIDNIASQANCRALAAQIVRDSGASSWTTPRCIAVRKTRP